MNGKDIERLLPYETDYNLLSKCRKWGEKGLWGIDIFSILLPLLEHFSNIFPMRIIRNLVTPVYPVMIIAYYILNTYTETFLYPATARKRRKGFIDNSLGSKFLENPVAGYYTNDVVKVGPYKMIVNCGENCYFTMNIANKMLPQVVIKNTVCGTVYLIIACFGLRDNFVSIPILQILLSSLFFTELVYHINFIAKLNQLFERFKGVFSKKPDDSRMLQEAVLLYLDYETTLAYNKAPLSNSIYKKLNKSLSKEWEGIKARYDISQ